MDAALVNPFIEGVLHILDTTAFVKVKPVEPFFKKNRESLGDISGLLEISGDLSGTAVIGFSKKSILGIVSTMFGEDMTRIDEEIHDAVGEISNMIAGHVTTKMGETGKQVNIRFKKILTGGDFLTDDMADTQPVIVLPFKTTKGKVVLEICYNQ